jgi:hypothetical protein
LNLKGRAKEWFKILNPTPTDWTELRILIIQKYKDDNVNDIQMNFDAIKQDPKERAQKYLNVLKRFFKRAKYKMQSNDRDFWPCQGQKSASCVL